VHICSNKTGYLLVLPPNVLPQIAGSAEGMDAAAILARKAEVEAAMAKGRGRRMSSRVRAEKYDIGLKCFWADCFQILKHPPGHHERQKHTVRTNERLKCHRRGGKRHMMGLVRT